MDPAVRNQEETMAQNWAAQHNARYFDVRTLQNPERLVGVFSVKDMQAMHMVPLGGGGPNLTIGYTQHADLAKIRFLCSKKYPSVTVAYAVISESGCAELIERLDQAELKQVTDSGVDDFNKTLAKATGKAVFRLLAQRAMQVGSSDIHIEPRGDGALVRFRIDGLLQPVVTLPLQQYRTAISELETSVGMTWGGDKPQGGRMTLELLAGGESRQINVRLESIPTLHGEEIIARLLNLDVRFLELANLGLGDSSRQLIERTIAHPHGMVLTVGPTGSGKTSMLYAIINAVKTPQRKVVTLEDPVEYDIPGASQVPVSSDDQELFIEKLRAVMRQDPDVIMIGEIRDIDTAKTALQAALTGHLVLSTFHANSAAGALSRLVDMIGQNPLLPSALRLVMAQRLVRRLCTVCKKAQPASEEQANYLRQVFSNLDLGELDISGNPTLYAAVGCAQCNNLGYKSRFAIIELLQMTQEMETLIGSKEATTRTIQQQAVADGMVTLLQDGLLRALQGETSYEEVLRMVDA